MVMCNKTPDSPGFVVYTWGRHVTMLKVYALSKCALNEKKKKFVKLVLFCCC